MKPVLHNDFGVFYFSEENPECLDFILNDQARFTDAYHSIVQMLHDRHVYTFQLISNHGSFVVDRAFDTRLVFLRAADVDRIIVPPPPPSKSWADMVEEEEEDAS
jgi:hypothetical protein